jgi:hypothetical protein
LQIAIVENTFPAFDSCANYAQKALLVGAWENGADKIKQCLKLNVDFVLQLEDLIHFHVYFVHMLISIKVIACLLILRKDIKDAVVTIITAVYDLEIGNPEAISASIKALLDHDKYIFQCQIGYVFISLLVLKTN